MPKCKNREHGDPPASYVLVRIVAPVSWASPNTKIVRCLSHLTFHRFLSAQKVFQLFLVDILSAPRARLREDFSHGAMAPIFLAWRLKPNRCCGVWYH